MRVKSDRFKIFLALILISPILTSVCRAEEQITITTYYPAPNGIYMEMRVNQMSVGSAYRGSVLSDGNMIISGSVGIGTPSPSAPLEVIGDIKVKGVYATDVIGVGTLTVNAPTPPPASNTKGIIDVNNVWLREANGGLGDWATNMGAGSRTWNNVTGSRAENVTYTNNHGYPIEIAISSGPGGGWYNYCKLEIIIDGNTIINQYDNNVDYSKFCSCSVTVPSGSTYQVVVDGWQNGAIVSWYELY